MLIYSKLTKQHSPATYKGLTPYKPPTNPLPSPTTIGVGWVSVGHSLEIAPPSRTREKDIVFKINYSTIIKKNLIFAE